MDCGVCGKGLYNGDTVVMAVVTMGVLKNDTIPEAALLNIRMFCDGCFTHIRNTELENQNQ